MSGLAYVAVRSFLPERVRVLGWTLAGGLVGGSSIVSPDGLDFTILDPRWLAVVMFTVIPAAGAGAMAALVERWAVGWWWRDRTRALAGALIVVLAAVVVLGGVALLRDVRDVLG